MLHRICLTLVVSITLFANTSRAEVEIYERRSEYRYETERGTSKRWHVSCAHKVQGKGKGTRFCDLELTSGEYFMGSPQTEIGGVTVTVGVYATRTGRSREFAVRIGRWADDKSVAKIVLGKNEFSKIVDYNRRVEWRGADGLPVIREFISAKSARYELVRDRTREAEKFTLLGFANAWAYAVNFVQFDPIQEAN